MRVRLTQAGSERPRFQTETLPIRALTVLDNHARQALAIVIDSGIRGEHVVETVEEVAARRGAPGLIRVDYSPEFVSKVLNRWAYERGAVLDFSRPGKPTDNAFVVSVHRRLPCDAGC